MEKLLRSLFFCVGLALVAQAQWIKQSVNTTASLRGLSVVSEKIVWASGTGGTVIRTIDGGKTWKVIAVPDADKLDFRDIEAFDASTAYILSIGNGDASRIYKTTDGGATWKLQFKNTNEKAFFDAIACWDASNCIAMSDPVDGHYVLMNTADGENWKPIVSNQLPAAKEGEAAFAASGTCLYINPKNGDAFLVSGGNDARVFKSADRGKTWMSAATPIVKGTAGSGIFSIAFRNELHGTIVGGNYEKPSEPANTVAFSRDGGKSWYDGEGLTGYRSAVTYIDDRTTIAVGTNGTDISYDRGGTWKKIGDENLNAVATKGKNAVWAVGPKGLVVRLTSSKSATRRADKRNRDIGAHPLNVVGVTLSHSTIRSVCSEADSTCSESRLVSIATTAVELEDSDAEYVYTVSGGTIVGKGANVEWDLTAVRSGTYTVTVGIAETYAGRKQIWGTTVTKTVDVK